MATVALLMFPEPGHILPTIRIARKLALRGHRIVYLCDQRSSCVLRALALDAVDVWPSWSGAGDGSWLAPSVFATNHWFEVAQRLGTPVGNITEALRCAASAWLLPAVRRVSADVVICDAYITDACGSVLMSGGPRIVPLRTNLPSPDASGEFRELVLCPPTFEVPEWRRESGGLVAYCEPSLRPRVMGESVPAGLEAIDLYCSLGTQGAAYPGADKIVEAVVGVASMKPAWRVVISVPPIVADGPARLPANVHLASGVNQLGALRRCNVAVMHGGLNGLKEAVMLGVPVVIIPLAFDQPLNAFRAETAGIGVSLSLAECSTETLLERVEEASELRLSPAMRAMRSSFARCERVAPAVHAIEAVCESTKWRV